MKPIVCPDIHGQWSYLEWVLKKFPDRKYVFLGDLIDRGLQSRSVVKKVIELVESGQAVLVLGNHEDMAIRGQLGNDEKHRFTWINNGGVSCKKSYLAFHADDEKSAMDDLESDLKWIQANAHDWYEFDDVLCTHAMRPEWDEINQVYVDDHWNTYLWGRPDRSRWYKLRDGIRYSIHGHTPTKSGKAEVHIEKSGIAFIDLGGFSDYRPNTYCVWDAESEEVIYYEH